MFYAPELQGVPENYQHLLAALYIDQKGTMPQLGELPILHGVKQSDVLSPILFNAGLQLAMERWNAQLDTHGIKLVRIRKTNARHTSSSLTI